MQQNRGIQTRRVFTNPIGILKSKRSRKEIKSATTQEIISAMINLRSRLIMLLNYKILWINTIGFDRFNKS